MVGRRLLQNTVFLVAVWCIVQTLQVDRSENQVETGNQVYVIRPKRATRKPGFFRTLFQVTMEQFRDTKDTYRKVNDMINDNFLPENVPVTTTPRVESNNATTTAAPYKITRSEFNKIIQRNVKGLARLFNIELREALKQSDKNYAEFRRNTSVEVSKFL
ncbi:uncharacterized protein LOC132704926 [Cylas formicarius]|uniref:uncharacterized protein LOC132704926 n=1 Tax=Cylas formicarius TaxID=197179 RepID=UPI0029588E89|nr:uncharacterized protein LOC132704926 [Cylas formicarius]XP_060531247.1 uncharacterized protein LOC132704926 [Cylas formicarius]